VKKVATQLTYLPHAPLLCDRGVSNKDRARGSCCGKPDFVERVGYREEVIKIKGRKETKKLMGVVATVEG